MPLLTSGCTTGRCTDVSLSIDEVRQWFSACGYAVSEEVGAFGGSVDRFATPRHGLMPPRTWWTVVPRFPDDLYAATENLDLARDNIGADRALAIVTEEVTPDGYSPDLNGGVANYVSARHLALHLAGVFDELSAMVREPRTSLYFSHRIRAPSGETMDACERIDTWIEQGTEGELEIRGGPSETIAEVVRETARRRAERFLERPDHVVPIVFASPGAGARTMLESLLERGWIVRANISRSSGGIIAIRRLAVPTGGPPTLSRRVEELVEMSVIDAVAWFRAAAPEAPAGAFRALLQRDETARRLLQGPIMRGSILHAALEEQRSPVDDSWLPRVLARAFQSALDRATGLTSRPPDTWAPVEEAALREFALGESDLGLRRYLDLLLLVEVGLLRVDQRAPRERGEGSGYKFASTCVRDWFLARKIARDVRAGNSDVLARYVFPRDVGLFLAVIAPDVAAHASSSRAEEIRRDVESEVARRVELTLGHQLNRSIGAIGAHARTVRRALRESEMDDHLRGGPRRGRLNVEDTPAARVLLVEDDDGNATDYLAWLRDGRHTVQRAKAASDAAELADSFEPDVVLLDMQIPSVPEAADADVVHGLRTLDELVRRDPFRPVVVVTAHSRNRELMRDVLQRTHGGQFVFKDDRNLEQSLLNAVAVAVNQPAFRMSRAVRAPKFIRVTC